MANERLVRVTVKSAQGVECNDADVILNVGHICKIDCLAEECNGISTYIDYWECGTKIRYGVAETCDALMLATTCCP